MASNPPTDVTFAAAVVQSWLSKQNPASQGKATDEQFKQMSAAERIDYCRRFDQTQFQKTKDRHGR